MGIVHRADVIRSEVGILLSRANVAVAHDLRLNVILKTQNFANAQIRKARVCVAPSCKEKRGQLRSLVCV